MTPVSVERETRIHAPTNTAATKRSPQRQIALEGDLLQGIIELVAILEEEAEEFVLMADLVKGYIEEVEFEVELEREMEGEVLLI
jgi:hypothetical protein